MSPNAVVVVESPAKAQTINKYLGSDFHVLASYGHIRDLPSKNGSVDPDNGFTMVWETDPRSQKHVKDIEKALKGAEKLILATDPDREGEAISWHVHNALAEKGLLKNKAVERVVFNEITKSAIQQAMGQPRQVDDHLVNAYLARRALDYLVGFTLSPILWRKLPGSRSAGRVQSVALRLVCERESEIEAFTPEEYWSIAATMVTTKAEIVPSRLTVLFGDKLDKLDLKNEAMATEAVEAIKSGLFTVSDVEKRQAKRHPQPPFITSTLQQDASRKLGFSATRTMQTAQRLYEGISLGGETVGLITYMRTDGVNLAQEALNGIRKLIDTQFGDKYLPEKPKFYKSKAKNAQEAHEAIRPTDAFRTPQKMKAYLTEDQYKLYDLIWKRAVACQMESAILDQVRVDMTSQHAKGNVVLRANGSVVLFDGFTTLYKQGRDEDSQLGDSDDENNRVLPPLEVGQSMIVQDVLPEQHFTKPPPRFTEASMVKTLEELGIGRPSTYASIIRVLQERNYVRMESRRFVPEDRGRLVTTFLTEFFPQYVAYDFTAKLEEQLDDISGDRLDWQKVLKEFWLPFKEKVGGAADLTITEVLDALDAALERRFFAPTEDNPNPRHCAKCEEAGRDGGRLGLKLGRFGAFIGCVNYPECKLTRQLDSSDGDIDAELADGPKPLGKDPDTGKTVVLNKGPYGYYVQLGTPEEIEADAEALAKKPPELTKAGKPKKVKPPKPKRASLPSGTSPTSTTLESALGLLALPRRVGDHPETGEEITAGLGRFGPYLKMGDLYVSVKGEDDVRTIGLDRAVDVIVASGKKVYSLGEHKKKKVSIQKGRFGYYIKFGTTVKVNLPKGTDPEVISLEHAIELIDKKVDAAKKAPTKPKTTKAKTATKTKAKKASTKRKKAAPKKTSS
jgi:DNA topoisomerase-1